MSDQNPSQASAEGATAAEPEYRSGAGCLLMTIGVVVCAGAIVAVFLLFGDFASG